MKQPHRWKIWVALIIIVVIYWLENEYISQANDVENTKRKIFHILSLIAVMGIGYFAWYKHPVKWIPKLWLLSYSLMLFIMLLVGAINWKFNIFGTTFLDIIRTLRLFFISPLPLLALYVLSRIKVFTNS